MVPWLGCKYRNPKNSYEERLIALALNFCSERPHEIFGKEFDFLEDCR